MLKPAVIAEFHAFADDAIRAHVNIGTKLGAGVDDGGGVDHAGKLRAEGEELRVGDAG